MKKILRDDWLSIGVILLVSILSVFDLFMATGQSANMDGIVHMITPNLFAHSLLQGNFPVTWIDNFANYGLPLGIISQQFSTYLTALIILLVHSPVLAFNITLFIGVLLSNVFYYLFLRIYFKPIYAMVGVFLFTLAPYRILNMYIRGAMPEFFSSVFMPLLLLSLYLLLEKKKITGFFLLIFSVAALILTHPFMLVVSSFFLFPYVLFLLYKNNQNIKNIFFEKKNIFSILLVGIGLLIGFGIAGYYFLPLNREIKYFYYGLHPNHLTSGNYLTLPNFIGHEWFYFTPGDVLARGFSISVGILETISVCIALLYLLWKWKKKEGRVFTLFEFSILVSLFYIFFITKFSDPFYQHINLLSNIQFPWRMLSGFIMIQPIMLLTMLEKINKKWVVLLVITVLLIIRLPQLYGKNYTLFLPTHYNFSTYNLHATVMNPIWSGRSEDYPVQTQKGVILEGQGSIEPLVMKDTIHEYKEDAKTPLHVVDYTFYFPGWNLYIDNQKSQIEYQDPTYRGVITYTVPPGNHVVALRFEETTIRKIGKLVTLGSLLFLLFFLVINRRLQKHLIS